MSDIVCVRMQHLQGLSLKDPDEIRTIFLVFFTVFEPLRLSAAYHGNLSEKVRNGTAWPTQSTHNLPWSAEADHAL
jgi:hypothetical protein